MSVLQLEATALLCRLLNFPEQHVNGETVFEGEWSTAALTLIEAGLLIKDEDLSSASRSNPGAVAAQRGIKATCNFPCSYQPD